MLYCNNVVERHTIITDFRTLISSLRCVCTVSWISKHVLVMRTILPWKNFFAQYGYVTIFYNFGRPPFWIRADVVNCNIATYDTTSWSWTFRHNVKLIFWLLCVVRYFNYYITVLSRFGLTTDACTISRDLQMYRYSLYGVWFGLNMCTASKSWMTVCFVPSKFWQLHTSVVDGIFATWGTTIANPLFVELTWV